MSCNINVGTSFEMVFTRKMYNVHVVMYANKSGRPCPFCTNLTIAAYQYTNVDYIEKRGLCTSIVSD